MLLCFIKSRYFQLSSAFSSNTEMHLVKARNLQCIWWGVRLVAIGQYFYTEWMTTYRRSVRCGPRVSKPRRLARPSCASSWTPNCWSRPSTCRASGSRASSTGYRPATWGRSRRRRVVTSSESRLPERARRSAPRSRYPRSRCSPGALRHDHWSWSPCLKLITCLSLEGTLKRQ